MKKLSMATAALMMGSTAAFAAGPAMITAERDVYMPATPAPSFNWGGLYGGASLGYGSSNYDLSASYDNPPTSVGITLPDLGGRGALGGLQIGYNFQLSDTLVAGLQLDGTFTGINNTTALSFTDGANTLTGDYTHTPRTMLTLGGRLGWLSTPDTMIYGTLGYTRGSFRGSYDVSVNGTPALNDSYSYNLNGVSVGMGIETRVARNATVGLEYRYTQFQRYSFYDGPALGGNLEAGFDSSVQSIRASYNLHF